MRGYMEKMAECRLPPDRTKELRRWCLRPGRGGRKMIDGIPVGVDMFRVYRARFYWLLDKKLTPTPKNTPQGGATAGQKAPRPARNAPRAE